VAWSQVPKNPLKNWPPHLRVEVSRQQAQKKICLDFVHARFTTSVWLQAGQHLALAAQIPAKQKSGCRPLTAKRIKKNGRSSVLARSAI
jgi:hypothetical protein